MNYWTNPEEDLISFEDALVELEEANANLKKVEALLASVQGNKGLLFKDPKTGDVCMGRLYKKDGENLFALYGYYDGKEEGYLIRLRDVEKRKRLKEQSVPIYINKGDENNYLFNELGITRFNKNHKM